MRVRPNIFLISSFLLTPAFLWLLPSIIQCCFSYGPETMTQTASLASLPVIIVALIVIWTWTNRELTGEMHLTRRTVPQLNHRLVMSNYRHILRGNGSRATWGGNETENQDSFPAARQSSPGCRDVFCSPVSGATPNLVPLFLSDVSGRTAYFGESGWSQNDSWGQGDRREVSLSLKCPVIVS